MLACLDGYMNIAMEQTEEYVNGQLKAKYGDTFIRGNNGTPPPHAARPGGAPTHRVRPAPHAAERASPRAQCSTSARKSGRGREREGRSAAHVPADGSNRYIATVIIRSEA